MIINLNSSHFDYVGGTYYSPAFVQNSEDSLVSVAVWTDAPATASMQASINEIDWINLTNTSFSVANAGLQTFTDCHIGLKYRIKITELPTQVQILI